MKLDNNYSNFNFGSIYCTITPRSRRKELESEVKTLNNNAILVDATDFYKNSNGTLGLYCAIFLKGDSPYKYINAAREKKDVTFIVTGKDADNAKYKKEGYKTVNDLAIKAWKYGIYLPYNARKGGINTIINEIRKYEK